MHRANRYTLTTCIDIQRIVNYRTIERKGAIKSDDKALKKMKWRALFRHFEAMHIQ